MKSRTAQPSPESTALVVVDIQERLVKAMDKSQISAAIGRCDILIQAALKLAIPVVVTEQYPKGLGPTVEDLKSHLPSCETFEKTSFSCFGCAAFAKRIKALETEHIVICGIETHVCVQQTAFDAAALGMEVFIPADAVCSRNSQNKETSLRLMLAKGISVTSTESLIFSILRDSSHPSFREISRILK